MLLTNVEHFLYLLNYVIKHRFLAEILADYRPYLCTVFFIVLDFKVNKGWSTAVLLFLCLYVSSYIKSYINRIFLVDTFKKNDSPF